MLLPGVTGFGVPVSVTCRSACAHSPPERTPGVCEGTRVVWKNPAEPAREPNESPSVSVTPLFPPVTEVTAVPDKRMTPPPPPPPGPWRCPGYPPGASVRHVLPPVPPLAVAASVVPSGPLTARKMIEPPAPPPPPASCIVLRAVCPLADTEPVPTTEPARISRIPPPAAPLELMPAGFALVGSAVPSLVVPEPPPPPIATPLMVAGYATPPNPWPTPGRFHP